MKQNKIYVVTSFYNTEKYVESMYSSILNQSYKHWSWVIADDFSTDNTANLLEEIVIRDSRITNIKLDKKKSMFWNPQKYVPKDTDIIVVADSDDYLLPYALEEINTYFNHFPDILGMAFCAMKYNETLPLFDHERSGLNSNFKEVPYFTEIKSYLSGMENLSPIAPHIFGTGASWRNIPIEFPEHKDEPWACSNDGQWFLILEEHGKVMNVPKVLKLVRNRQGSENWLRWSKNGEVILINEARKRRKDKGLVVEYPKNSFDDIKTIGEATYFSTLNFTLNKSISFVDFDVQNLAKVRSLFNTNKVYFDTVKADYVFVHIDVGTYVKDFIERYDQLVNQITDHTEMIFYISNKSMNFDVEHILEHIRTCTDDIIYESGDNRVAIVHNCQPLQIPEIRTPYKVKLVHTLCRPNDKREIESVKSLSQLKKYGIEYIQHINPPNTELITDPRPAYNPITLAHYGCYMSFKRAIKEEFTDNLDFLLFAECDCILEVPVHEFLETLWKTCKVIDDEKITYFSFGDNTRVDNGFLWSGVKRIIPNIEWMYITDRVALAHCLLFPRASREQLIEMLDNHDYWGVTDNLLAEYFAGKAIIGIIAERMAVQHEGNSIIDGVYRKRYTYDKKIVPKLLAKNDASEDTMLENITALYSEVKINPGRILTDYPKVEFNFTDGLFMEIKDGLENIEYNLSFTDGKNLKADYTVKTNHWARSSAKYYRDWQLLVKGVDNSFEWNHKFDLTGKKVVISFESNALGDTIAWIPYIDIFRKEHKCQVIVSTHWNQLFDKIYPELKFIKPGSVENELYALYRIGCYENQTENGKPKMNSDERYGYSDTNRNPNGWRSIPLQKIATDILGLEYNEIKPKINDYPVYNPGYDYITISEYSTMKAKEWNNLNGWYNIVRYLNNKGYRVLSLNNRESSTKGTISVHDKSIEEIVSILKGSKLHIGMGSGLSWMSWSLSIPTVIIAGFSDAMSEPNVEGRVINEGVCHGCYNDVHIPFEKGWLFCPRKKDFECTRSITSKMVTEEIDKILK